MKIQRTVKKKKKFFTNPAIIIDEALLEFYIPRK